MDLRGRVAVVTGGSHGIGRGIAVALASHGCNVVFCYSRDREGSVKTVAQVEATGAKAVAVQADVSSPEQVNSVIKTTLEKFGQVDILVNNAAVLTVTPLLEMTEDEWDRVVDVNLKGYFLMGQAAAREMVRRGRGGRIINLGSVLGEWPLPGRTHYSATKAGIVMLTKVWAIELAEYGITANCIEPGTIESEMTAPMLATEDQRRAMTAPIPLGRIGESLDIGAAAAFLASDEASYITGATLLIDGGLTIAPNRV